MSKRFAGKSVLVSGAASGIGRAAAIAFAAEGGRVAVVDRSEADGRKTVATILEAGGLQENLRRANRFESRIGSGLKAADGKAELMLGTHILGSVPDRPRTAPHYPRGEKGRTSQSCGKRRSHGNSRHPLHGSFCRDSEL